MIEDVTLSRINVVLMRLNEARRRQITMGHIATEGDIEAAISLIHDMRDERTARAANPKPLTEPHWSPFDTEVRD